MKSKAQPGHEELTDRDAAAPVTQPDQDEQPKDDAVKSEVQPDSQEQTDDDAVTPMIEPDQDEQPKENAAIGWMKNILSKVTNKS